MQYDRICMSVCVCARGQSDQFKTVKATEFKFDMHVPTSQGQSGYDPLKFFEKGASVKIHFAEMHSHECLLLGFRIAAHRNSRPTPFIETMHSI